LERGANSGKGGPKIGGVIKLFSPAAGIVTDVFCWRNLSESPKYSKKRLSFVLGT
jgi:hypothetical protein